MDSVRKILFLKKSELIKEIHHWRSCVPLWHPLGFVSLPLTEGAGWALKIHYWPKGTRKPKKPDWPIHDHRFHIESRVLLGVVGNWKYKIIEGGEERLFPVSYSGKDSVIMPHGNAITAVLDSKEYHVAGEVYEICRKTFHQAYVPIEESAITLVLQTDFVEQPPFVVGRLGIAIEEYKRTVYSKEKIWDAIINGSE